MKSILIGMALLAACAASSQTKETMTVYFDFNKAELNEKALMAIDSFLSVQHAGPPIARVALNGYCDSVGSSPYNTTLSLQRVATIKKLLISNYDIKATTITSAGYGETKPVNSNTTEEERELNRRVEIILTLADQKTAKKTDQNLKAKIADSSTVSGTNIVLKNINFYGGRHELMQESTPTLLELLDAMKTYPNLVIQIEGHICCELGPEDGIDMETGHYDLSEARAKAIYDYLLDHGIDRGRVSYKGLGHSQPIYLFPEQTEQQRLENRRVEIKIIRK